MRLHRACIVTESLTKENGIENFPWPSRRHDMDPIEDCSDCLGCNVRIRNDVHTLKGIIWRKDFFRNWSWA